MPVGKRTPLQGELDCASSDFDVPDILLTVCETKGTGLLTFSTGEAEKTLFVRGGSFVFAKSSSIDDRLGEYLLRTGRVTLKDLARLSKLVQPGKRLGTLLVESGALDPKGLVQAVVGQVRSIVLSLFRWTKAQYSFVEQELPSKETITLNMPTAQLIVDGIRGIESWWRIERGIGELDSVYRTVSGTEGSLRSLDLDTPALELLAMLSKPKRTEEVCTDSALKEMEVCRLLWAFRSLGWVELVEDDGSSLLDNWQVDEKASSSEGPAPTVPIVGAGVEPGGNGAGPRFESDAAVPSWEVSGPPFPSVDVEGPGAPPAEGEPPLPRGDEPSAVPLAEKPGSKPQPEAERPVMGMDLDMEGLGEVLKGGQSE